MGECLANPNLLEKKNVVGPHHLLHGAYMIKIHPGAFIYTVIIYPTPTYYNVDRV